MAPGFIDYFHVGAAEATGGWQSALLRHGYSVSLHAQPDTLCAAARTGALVRLPRLVLLDAPPDISCRAAIALRRIDSQVPIAALLATFDETAVGKALQSGIDACWPRRATPAPIVASLRRIMGGGVRSCNLPQPAQPIADASGWQLLARAWTIQAPGGFQLDLTSAERALVLALCRAPGKRLSHAEMLCIMRTELFAASPASRSPAMASGESGSGPTGADPLAARRLGVLLSRLRQKFLRAGLDMPIRSVRGVGYELCAEISILPDGMDS